MSQVTEMVAVEKFQVVEPTLVAIMNTSRLLVLILIPISFFV